MIVHFWTSPGSYREWRQHLDFPQEKFRLTNCCNSAVLETDTQMWGQAVVMGSWWYDRHMPTAQPELGCHRELRQTVADAGCPLPLATVQCCQASESIRPGWREREACGAGMQASSMLSSSENLCCFSYLQLPQAFEAPLTGWIPPEVFLRSSWGWGFFFPNWKKKSQALSCKKQ